MPPAPITNSAVDAGDPAVVALVNANEQVVCTATLIGPHHAITAAHCVADRDPHLLRVFVGSVVENGGALLAVSDTRVHPQFNPGSGDIAMITLFDAASVEPLPLADAPAIGTAFTVVGFGLTGQNAMDSGTKRMGTARVAGRAAEEWVAIPEPSLSCLGDSGGPAILDDGAIAGVVSRGDAMCMDHAVYSRIDSARSDLVDPYLAETAPGTAGLGEPCLYAEHCGAGTCVPGEADPDRHTCEPDTGCGCASGDASLGTSLGLAVLVALAVPIRFSHRRSR